VLNAFAYTGAFGVHAGRAGARRVVGVETSESALALARANWELNGLPPDALHLVRQPVQRFLRDTRETFELIVLDPPPFARERRMLPRAARAYKDLNLWAVRRLSPGGFLATFSCSQAVGVDLFQKIVYGAALDAGARLQWIARLGPGPDHPVHIDHPEGEYLKGLLLRSLEG
jgi:23S rRNA (cytosine1962-C5)-methyltransferase